jgi:hypothetical protein
MVHGPSVNGTNDDNPTRHLDSPEGRQIGAQRIVAIHRCRCRGFHQQEFAM